YYFRDYRNAVFYLKEALKDNGDRPWNFNRISIINTLGLSYRALNELDSSSDCFRRTYDLATQKHLREWEGISSGNLGENYFMRKEYEKAKPLLQKDADIGFYTDPGLSANALVILAEISLEQKDIKRAEQQLKQAQECAYRSGEYKRLGT